VTASDIPLPYIRPINLEKERKVTHKYCLEGSTSTSILKKDKDGTVIEEMIETKTYTKDHEVELTTYSCKPTEDLVRLFEVIDTIRQRMAKPWKEVAEAQTNNAQLLFDALDFVLQHATASEWKISINLMEETFKEATPKCNVHS
jgi:flavoprotein